jgi:hypothetical protein
MQRLSATTRLTRGADEHPTRPLCCPFIGRCVRVTALLFALSRLARECDNDAARSKPDLFIDRSISVLETFRTSELA